MPFALRPATRADARDIAALFRISSEGAADYIWSKLAAPGQDLLDVGTGRYSRENTDFSYQNCVMATADGQVAGMLHSYPMVADPDPSPPTDPVLAPYAGLEIPGTLYISSLARYEGWRNQGLGTRLLEAARQRAAALGLAGLSLIDYASNTGARRFYERHGFRIVDACTIVPHPMLRVTGEAYLMQYP